MKILIDTTAETIAYGEGAHTSLPLYSTAGFEFLTDLWLKQGWALKLPYTYSWLGFPILQLPDDMIRMQEVIARLKPDVIVETGVAHGGSVIFYASLCRALGHGEVIGIEKGLRCRKEVEASYLANHITLLEGDSVDPAMVCFVRRRCADRKTLVILDSDHSKEHVAKELEAYSGMVSLGSYIVATDGNMGELADVPRGKPEWSWNNPKEAAKAFAYSHSDFEIEQPAWPFNESELRRNVTYWPSAWLKRVKISSGAGDKALTVSGAPLDLATAGTRTHAKAPHYVGDPDWL